MELSFFAGMAAMGFLTAGMFFFKFWRRTQDTLFFVFGCAFCVFAASQTILLWSPSVGDQNTWVYGLRAATFLLLIAAIVVKNWPEHDQT